MFVRRLLGGEGRLEPGSVYLSADVCAGIGAAVVYVGITRTRRLLDPAPPDRLPKATTSTSV
jgi:hypothetical protein